MKPATQTEITRSFWALFLDSTVEKDGHVPGFRAAWNRMSEFAQQQADRYCHFTWVKIQRAGRDPDECIAAGVAALREQIRLYRPPAEAPADPAYTAFRIALVQRILDEKLKPIEVARILEAEADRFPQVTVEECVAYREMGERWQPWSGQRISEEDRGFWGRHVLQDRREKQSAREARDAMLRVLIPNEESMPMPQAEDVPPEPERS